MLRLKVHLNKASWLVISLNVAQKMVLAGSNNVHIRVNNEKSNDE